MSKNPPLDPGSGKNSLLGSYYEIGQPPLKSLEILRHLQKWELQAIAKVIMPETRLKSCFRTVRHDEQGVKVWKHKEKSHYSGLMVCGSIWICPVCAAKISERRRLELQMGHAAWKAKGGFIGMLTLTIPHHAGQPLKQVLEGFNSARKLMMNRKPYKGLKRRFRVIGTVRALEVTYGVNGWHVHSHEMLFSELEIDQGAFAAAVLVEWQKACESVGLEIPNGHGVQADGEFEASRYLGKWGMDCELTKGHIKHGREGNYSPWDFLRNYHKGGAWGDLFREYSRAFTGKRQLVWSEGMRDLLGLGKEATDKELAEEIKAEAVLLGMLSRADWKIVLAMSQRGELLNVAAAEGWSGVLAFIEKLIAIREESYVRIVR